MSGLNLSPTTVFAQVFPHDRTFPPLRRQLGGIADHSVSQSSGERLIDVAARNLAHANIVRFSGGVTTEFVQRGLSLSSDSLRAVGGAGGRARAERRSSCREKDHTSCRADAAGGVLERNSPPR